MNTPPGGGVVSFSPPPPPTPPPPPLFSRCISLEEARWEGREGAVSPKVSRLPVWVGPGAAAAEKAKVELERLQASERILERMEDGEI